MTTARVFTSGNSQAVRLPKEFRFDTTEVTIFRRGDEVVLKAKPRRLADAFHLLAGMPDDFFPADRADPAPQKRKGL